MSKVLIAGATGGREHALGEAMADEGHKVYFSHGNAGSREVGANLGFTTHTEIIGFASKQAMDMVVVGPEAPLVEGLANGLRERGLTVFGPNHYATRLEASKAYSAMFMPKYGLPHADSLIINDLNVALEYANNHPAETYVIKANGLAGGKGAILPETEHEARRTLADMMSGRLFGEAGRTVVLSERLFGPELSALLVTDSRDFVLLPLARDYKRLKDGNEGPNTGGMGSYAPVPPESPRLIEQIMDMGERTVFGLHKEGYGYQGVIYLGLMLDENDDYNPKIIEYNVRFGDPETQPLVSVLKSAGVSMYDLLYGAARGRLDRSVVNTAIRAAGAAAVSVCLAANGYPADFRLDDEIFGLGQSYPDVDVYHGGTRYDENTQRILTAGGRVLYVTGKGKAVEQAAVKAYAAIGEHAIHFADMQYRKHIAGHSAAQ